MSLFIFSKDKDPELNLGQPARWLTELEAMRLWSRVFGEGVLAPHETHHYRVIMAWRMTRALARHQGRLSYDDRLSTAFDTDQSWDVPMAALVPTVSTKDTPPPETWSTNHLLSRDGGLALAPTVTENGHVARFASMAARIASEMWLERGSKMQPKLGEYGLCGLLDPSTIVQFWPSRHALFAWEAQLMKVVRLMIIQQTRPRIEQYLQDLLDLTEEEASGLFLLGTAMIRDAHNLDKDTNRAVIEAQLEEVIYEATACGDTTNRLRGIKMLADVQGVGASSLDSSFTTLLDSMKEVNAERSKQNFIQIEDSKGESS